jgi:hypothetical protein
MTGEHHRRASGQELIYVSSPLRASIAVFVLSVIVINVKDSEERRNI